MKVIFKPLSRDVKDAFSIDCKDNSRLTIGRKEGNDIVLPFRNVSSFHAIIECIGGVLFLEDLNSTNGTFLNEERIQGRVSVKNNDRIKFASYEFLVDFQIDSSHKNIDDEIPSEGTVFMDASNLEEIQQILEPDTVEEIKKANIEETSKETVLYGVKGLVQNGRIVLLDDNRHFLEEYELEEIETSIGRDVSNNISIEHASISRVHCFINKKDQYYEIVDNNSTNGVFVNEKKVKKSILKNGDIVKLGDKEFVYIAPGELFSPVFFEKKKGKTSGGFDRKKIYIGLFVFFFLLIMVLALLPSGEKKVRKIPKISEKELKLDVINSFKNEDWDNVIYLIENFNLKGFDKEYKQAKFEIKNRKAYLKLVDLLDNNNFDEAKKILDSIPEASVYFNKSKELFKDKKDQFVSKKLEEIDELMDENRLVKAYESAKKLKEKFPQDSKVIAVARDLEKKYNIFIRRKQARIKFVRLRRKIRGMSRNFVEKAKDLYLEGNIVDSIAKLIDARQLYIAKNLPVPERITRLKENLSVVRGLYLDGKKLIMQGRTDEAAKKFEKLFSISKNFLWGEDGKIENECKKLLQEYYIKKAKNAYRQNNYTNALSFADKVLDISPENREMQSLKRDILRTAKSLYNKGYIEQTQYNNCKSALFYFKQVVEILPSSDPIYKKAMKRIKECEK